MKRILLLVCLIVSLVELDWERGRIYSLSAIASLLLVLYGELIGRRRVQRVAAEGVFTAGPGVSKDQLSCQSKTSVRRECARARVSRLLPLVRLGERQGAVGGAIPTAGVIRAVQVLVAWVHRQLQADWDRIRRVLRKGEMPAGNFSDHRLRVSTAVVRKVGEGAMQYPMPVFAQAETCGSRMTQSVRQGPGPIADKADGLRHRPTANQAETCGYQQNLRTFGVDGGHDDPPGQHPSTDCRPVNEFSSVKEKPTMRIIGIAVLLCSLSTLAFALEDVVSATHGTITKIDRTARTIAVKTADGTEHVFYWAKDTSVHGAKAADLAAKDSWHGLKVGSEVVAHSTKRGTKDTAVEVDKVGDTGLKRTEGTIKEIDRGGKKLVVESADGTEHAFTLTGHAATDAGKDLAAGGEKGTKVAIYSTEEAGKSVAHFFEKI